MDIVLEPIYSEETPFHGVEKELTAYFDEAIFDQLYALLRSERVIKENAPDNAVVAALKSHRIWYTDGVFSGQFNAAISRELRKMGAHWDKTSKVFRLPSASLPMSVRLAAAESTEAAKQTAKKILDTLNQMEANLRKARTGVNLVGPVNDILKDLQSQLGRSLSARGVAVPADLSESVKAEIVKGYTENMDLLIKNFAQSRIPELRRKIEQNVFAGARTDKLTRIIQAEQGISRRKAAFLAEQETSLLVSKYRESRYKAIGARRYVWQTSRDVRVRHDHKELQGKVFSWDSPPITNHQTGERNHPGEDFGCRCVARPILSI